MKTGSLLVNANNAFPRWRCVIYMGRHSYVVNTNLLESSTHEYLLGDGSYVWTNDDLTQLGWIEFI